MYICDLILYLLAIHLGEGEVTENASKILSIDGSSVSWIIKSESIFDLVLLYERIFTISSESLLFKPAALLPLALVMFFLANGLLISYKKYYLFEIHKVTHISYLSFHSKIMNRSIIIRSRKNKKMFLGTRRLSGSILGYWGKSKENDFLWPFIWFINIVINLDV